MRAWCQAKRSSAAVHVRRNHFLDLERGTQYRKREREWEREREGGRERDGGRKLGKELSNEVKQGPGWANKDPANFASEEITVRTRGRILWRRDTSGKKISFLLIIAWYFTSHDCVTRSQCFISSLKNYLIFYISAVLFYKRYVARMEQ